MQSGREQNKTKKERGTFTIPSVAMSGSWHNMASVDPHHPVTSRTIYCLLIVVSKDDVSRVHPHDDQTSTMASCVRFRSPLSGSHKSPAGNVQYTHHESFQIFV